MTVKEWLKATYSEEWFVRPHAICADGFRLSIQASSFHYCCPKISSPDTEYECVEIGYPSKVDELQDEYHDGAVYPYVPIELVEKVVEKHGGIIANV